MENDAFDTKLMLDDNIAESKKNLEKIKEEYRDQALLYADVFKTTGAAKILDDLQQTFTESASFVPGRNLNDVCYYEGQKSVIKYITTLINYNYTIQ